MSNGLVSLLFGLGVSAWAYSQLARRNGNANPANNAVAAVVGGLIAAIFIFTFLKFVLNF